MGSGAVVYRVSGLVCRISGLGRFPFLGLGVEGLLSIWVPLELLNPNPEAPKAPKPTYPKGPHNPKSPEEALNPKSLKIRAPQDLCLQRGRHPEAD